MTAKTFVNNFHPFYTLTNQNSFDTLYNHLKITLSLILSNYEWDQNEQNYSLEEKDKILKNLISYFHALYLRYKCQMPHTLSSMYHILIVLIEERKNRIESPNSNFTFSNGTLELAMSSALQRFISGLAEIMQQYNYSNKYTSNEKINHKLDSLNQKKESYSIDNINLQTTENNSHSKINGQKIGMKILLHKIQIPEYIISLRNRISHNILPSKSVLTHSLIDSTKWIQNNYWERIQSNISQYNREYKQKWDKYMKQEIQFQALGNDLWCISKVIANDIVNCKLPLNSSAIDNLLKDENQLNNNKDRKQINFTETIVAEIINLLFQETRNRNQIEISIRWVKYLIKKLDPHWLEQLLIHINSLTDLDDTNYKIQQLLLDLFSNQFKNNNNKEDSNSKQNNLRSLSQKNKRRKLSIDNSEEVIHDWNEVAIESNEIIQLKSDINSSIPNNNEPLLMFNSISKWEIVDAFHLPIGHVIPYSLHSSYTYKNFQLEPNNIISQFVDLR